MSDSHLELKRRHTATLNKTRVLLVRMRERICNPHYCSLIHVLVESACLNKFQQRYTPDKVTEHSHHAWELPCISSQVLLPPQALSSHWSVFCHNRFSRIFNVIVQLDTLCLVSFTSYNVLKIVHDLICINTFFIFIAELYSIAGWYTLGYFQFGTVEGKASVNLHIQVSM